MRFERDAPHPLIDHKALALRGCNELIRRNLAGAGCLERFGRRKMEPVVGGAQLNRAIQATAVNRSSRGAPLVRASSRKAMVASSQRPPLRNSSTCSMALSFKSWYCFNRALKELPGTFDSSAIVKSIVSSEIGFLAGFQSPFLGFVAFFLFVLASSKLSAPATSPSSSSLE